MTVQIPKKHGIKRKHSSNPKLLPNKKTRRAVDSLNDLPWKKLARSNTSGFEGDDGILELEEVDDVEIIYEDTENGRIAKFIIPDQSEDKAVAVEGEEDDIKMSGSDDDKGLKDGASDASAETESFDVEGQLPEWSPYSLHPRILSGIHQQNFTKPTPIQARALPSALKGKDIVGVAETGSGKTLAYGLPILQYLLNKSQQKKQSKRELKALILAPTRELALQVSTHLKACLDVSPSGKGKEKASGPPRVSIAAVVGGMAAQKQRRLLDRGVDVIVATPGRLWDLIEEDDSLAEQIKKMKFLVLDEADRMIEAGHFAELDNIVRLTSRQVQEEQTDPNFSTLPREDNEHEEMSDDGEGSSSSQEDEAKGPNDEGLQTFVFSATLSRDLQQNLRKRKRMQGPNKKRKGANKPASTLDELLLKLDFRDPEPEVIDLSPEGGVVSTLRESQIECLSGDKDVYLYYFLLRYPGRSLVFLSSIDGIRRLLPLMELLQLKAFPLHSQLQQRQRLKNLDRFKSISNSILLATDIAARGLDIPSVDHVIHYQIPRSADAYIHRNGRTARASRDGFSLLMCAPDERRVVKALLSSLERVGENVIPDMPVELDLLDKLKARVQLAKKIDTTMHRAKKEKHEEIWLREAAEAMEIELDSDLDDRASDDEEAPSKKRSRNKEAQKAQAFKMELKHLLSQPLVAKGVMKKYITSGARSVVADLLENSDGRDGMLGFKRGDAKSDLSDGKALRGKRKSKPKPKEVEEWHGFGS